MIFHIQQSPSRIIILLKTHIIDNLKIKSERKERSFRENRRKGTIFAINKKGAKTFRCGVDFQKSPSSDFIWRALLATSSLAVGPFAAK